MITKNIRLKRYCKNYWGIENYNEAVNDTEQLWDLHHKDETDLKMTSKELLDRGLYYDCKPERLIFLPHNEHTRLHMCGNKYGKNKKPWNKGLTDCYSDETLKKMSEAHKGNKYNIGKKRSAESRRKMSEAHKITVCPLILWKLRILEKLSWKKIGIQLSVSRNTVVNKWKEYNLDNLNI